MLRCADRPPDMPGHLWPLPWAGWGVAAADVAALVAEWEVTADEAAPVDALAIVTPRASVAPRAPAPTAVPMSGRLIRTASP
jgi:hypothetical protein